MKILNNNSVIESLFKAWNSHDIEGIIENYHDTFIREEMGNSRSYGTEKLNNILTEYFAGFPDIQFEIETLIQKNEKYVVCWKATGHHRGKIMNIPPTGKQISFTGVSVITLFENKINRVWYMWDQASMLRQMGLLPELKHSA